MKTKKLLSIIMVALFALPFVTNAQSELISRFPTAPDGAGKKIVSIHSYSAQTKWQEGPVNMLFPEMNANEDKWCDNSTPQPWVVFSFANYYNIDKIVITDAQIREKSNGNISEYKIFTTTVPYDEIIQGWEESDWVEVYHGVAEDEVVIKEINLDIPQETLYLKFLVLDRGHYTDGRLENAVRVYGFDIYGTYSRDADRGDLISVGKTILKAQDASNRREGAVNILDGNHTNKNSKWCFGGFGQTTNYRYAVIDLEGMYDISKFKLIDANIGEPGTQNLDGVNIYVSTVAPNLSVINMTDDDPNTCWTKVIDSDFETALDIKEYPLEEIQTSRFIKLEIPAYKAPGGDSGATSRIFQFEVYGTDTPIADDDATLSLLTVSTGSISPDFEAVVTDYSVSVDKEVDHITISASPTNKEAVVTGTGIKNLELGTNNYPVLVTAKDGVATKTYNLTVNRATQSRIASLESITASVGVLFPSFNSDSTKYFLDVPFGTESVDIAALVKQENAQMTGTGTKYLSGTDDIYEIAVTAEDGTTVKTYTITVVAEKEGLLSVGYGLPTGKRIVNVHSYSGKASDSESPYKLFLGERLNTNGVTSNKWCDNSNIEPWVILSLTDIYEINRIVIRDGRLIESANANVANVGSYKIEVSTTGTDMLDFSEIASENPDGIENVYDIDYLQDEARYIKFTFSRGFKGNGDQAGAIWIYGIDIYGEKTQDIDRAGVVSVGKTIVSRSSNAGDRESPCNLLDGNIGYEVEDAATGETKYVKHDPWAFNRSNGDGWVIVDLENVYYIDSLKVYDTEEWIQGYEVSVNTTGNDEAWTKVYSGTFEPELEEYEDENWVLKTRTVGPDPKTAVLKYQTEARFVKLFIPLEMQSPSWNRIREFEVYGSIEPTGLNRLSSDAASLVVYPNPITKGNSLYLNEQGNITIYSLQGSKVLEITVSGATNISTSNLEQGSYILRLSNASGVKQAKLIVK